MIEKIRTFFEIRLSRKTQKEIMNAMVDIAKAFAEGGWKVRWVHPDNIHLTIRFLGDIDIPMVEILKGKMQDLHQINSFFINVKGLGAFPSLSSPRIIWVGVEDPENQLQNLANLVEEKLGELGFEKESKKFHPHITIGRVAYKGSIPGPEIVEKFAQNYFGQEVVREIIFMKSKLTSERAIHTPLWNISFRRSRVESAEIHPSRLDSEVYENSNEAEREEGDEFALSGKGEEENPLE